MNKIKTGILAGTMVLSLNGCKKEPMRFVNPNIIKSSLVQPKINRSDSIGLNLWETNSTTKVFEDFTKRGLEQVKRADSIFMLNFPKLPKPSLNLNVAETKYVGSPKFLDIFLTGGVLEGKGEQFCKAQEKHGINATFLAGIANHESWYGKSDYAINRNNIAGMRGKNGYLTFKSIDECIDKMAENIKQNYINQGYKTIGQSNKKYAESTEWSDCIIRHITPLYNASKAMIYDFR